MRLLKTFIVRIYFDVDEPERLCGNIRPLKDQKSYPFKSQTEFESMLLQLIGKSPRTRPTPPDLNIKPDQEKEFGRSLEYWNM